MKEKIEQYKEIKKLQDYIKTRIKEIETKINNINKQLLNLEFVLTSIKNRIDSYDEEKQMVTKSKLMRWYIEDIKIYDELNNIRIRYEEILTKYTDQLFNSNYKLEELQIKKSKIDSENNQLQKMLEELEEKMKRNKVELKELDIDFDKEYQI